MSISITAGGTALPSPESLAVSNEIVWSANTGRTASGRMVGDAVAEKDTYKLGWGVLTGTELDLIREKLKSGFLPVTVTLGDDAVTIEAYRGTIAASLLGTFGGVTYYNEVAVTIIQR